MQMSCLNLVCNETLYRVYERIGLPTLCVTEHFHVDLSRLNKAMVNMFEFRHVNTSERSILLNSVHSPPTLSYNILSSLKVPKNPQKSQSKLDNFHLFSCSTQISTVIQYWSPQYALYSVAHPH